MIEAFKQNLPERVPLSIFVEEDFFNKVESGKKTLEVRTAYPKFQTIMSGSIIEFKSGAYGERLLRVEVKSVRRYKDRIEMLDKEDMKKATPGLTPTEIHKMSDILFVAEDVERYGIVAIEFEKIGLRIEETRAQEKPKNSESRGETMLCPNCSSVLVRAGACFKCSRCGFAECHIDFTAEPTKKIKE